MKLLIFFLTLFMATSIFSQVPSPLEPGVPQTLAKWRAANYSDVRYKLNITLEKGVPLMKGEIEIKVKLTDEGAKNDLILDWRTTQFQNDKDKPYARVVSLNGNTPLVIEAAEHLRISQQHLKVGENVIKIEFASPIKTSGSAITRYIDKEDGGEYVYSLFVPSDASTAFPVFDQPDLKAKFQLNIDAPKDWKVVSNTDTPSFEILSSGSFSSGSNSNTSKTSSVNSKEWKFFETKPISTYVFAFAAGDFTVFEEYREDKSPKGSGPEILPDNPEELQKLLNDLVKETPRDKSNIYVRKSQSQKFKSHEKEVFRLNREGVKFLESYFNYKFPFPKYDLVLIPEFPFGGMEHAGATFLRESSVIFPTEPTKNDYVSRANVMFHEAAHQWFGDTVTMKWFDDLWLKEGFAEFMAYKTLEKVMPEYNAWKIFYERNKQAAYLTDSTKGTTPIYQEIPNLSAAKSAYGNIVYRKAPSFLKQSEFYLGADKFQIAVRSFLKNHQYSNAEWTDLVREFETASNQNLKDWSEKWVKQRGMPIIKITREFSKEDGSLFGVSFEQNDILNEKGKWYVNFNVLTYYNNGERKITKFNDLPLTRKVAMIHPEGRHNNLSINYVFPNYQDYGYGIFLLDEKSRVYVLSSIQNEKDDFLRTMMWGSLWDSVREAELAPADYVRLVIKNINVETDEGTIQTLLGRTSTAMNYYLSDAQRNELAPQLENLLINKIQNAATAGQRITFYRAFLNTASSENARNVLKQVLKNDLGESGGNTKMRPGVKQIGGKTVKAANPAISLKTKDKYDIVTRLVILDDPEALTLLAGLAKTETGDDAKRYAYAALAGMGTAPNKQKYYEDFVNNKTISESYIETAFVSFNSIRQSELTLPFLEKSLAELPNLKRNRKIFFVNGWLGAFIGGQKSEKALQIVNKFLADNPNLDRDLRLKILENVDGLERAVKIRAKYRS